MRRKLISLLLTAVLSLSLMGTALAKTDPCAAFRDVNRAAWYHTALDYVVKNKLMNGTSSATFDPAGKVSRAMVVQTFYAIAEKPGFSGTSAFKDVKQGAWYFESVNWAAGNKLAAGYGDGTFEPNVHVSREHLAIFFRAFAGYLRKENNQQASLSGFTDATSVSSYAKGAMSWAVAAGIISGKDKGRLAPKDTASRAELAQMLYRFMALPDKAPEPSPSETVTPSPSQTVTPSVIPKPSESAKPSETPKPSESPKPSETQPVTPSQDYQISFNQDILDVEVGQRVTAEIETDAPEGTAITVVSNSPDIATCNGLVVTGKSMGRTLLTAKVGNKSATCVIYVNGFVNVDSAYTELNKFRTSANVWQWNEDNTTKTVFNSNSDDQLLALLRDGKLEETAKVRAKELVQMFDHTRPDGSDCFTAYPSELMAKGENIAYGYSTAESVTEAWEETNKDYAGQGHRRNMLRPTFKQVGIAGYMYRGQIYWTQAFGRY